MTDGLKTAMDRIFQELQEALPNWTIEPVYNRLGLVHSIRLKCRSNVRLTLTTLYLESDGGIMHNGIDFNNCDIRAGLIKLWEVQDRYWPAEGEEDAGS